MNWSARRLNAIASITNAKYYLEIGVNRGETFFDVHIDHKDGVDPDFRFDTQQYASETTRFFNMTSDKFWLSNKSTTYDLIMIDGLHTFEQTFRDLLCSMRFSHERTIWLIDDTVPSDVFSAIPNQSKSYHERKKLKLTDLPWHGDVFKMVMAIHDFIPDLNYMTILNSDNPQTIAWYGRRPAFQPRFNQLEAISRMSYFDIEPNASYFNFIDEASAMAQLKSFFDAND